MLKKIALINLIVCILVFFAITISSYFLDPEFAKFTATVSGMGLCLTWLFSPRHAVLDGIRLIPLFEWPIIGLMIFIVLQSNVIPSSFKLLIVLCVFFGGIGIVIASNKFLKKFW